MNERMIRMARRYRYFQIAGATFLTLVLMAIVGLGFLLVFKRG